MKRIALFLSLAMSGPLAWGQTLALPAFDAGIAPAVPVADLGEASLASPLDAGVAVPLGEPLPALSAAPSFAAPRAQRAVSTRRRPILRSARSAALASILAAAVALGLPACAPDRPLPEDGGTPDHPTWYLSYPNGHPLAAAQSGDDVLAAEQVILDDVNAYRSASHLGPLIPSAPMGDMARAHSIHMPMHGFFQSRNPEGDGPTERAARIGIAITGIQEDLAQGTADGHAVVQQWLADPEAKARLSDPHANRMGVGFYQEGEADAGGTPYWTVDVAFDPGLAAQADGGTIVYPPTYDAGLDPDAGLPPYTGDAGNPIPPGEDGGGQ
jgi:uncharacterized protein YkwD